MFLRVHPRLLDSSRRTSSCFPSQTQITQTYLRSHASESRPPAHPASLPPRKPPRTSPPPPPLSAVASPAADASAASPRRVPPSTTCQATPPPARGARAGGSVDGRERRRPEHSKRRRGVRGAMCCAIARSVERGGDGHEPAVAAARESRGCGLGWLTCGRHDWDWWGGGVCVGRSLLVSCPCVSVCR